ncbi:MAG: RNA polymerase sigma factor, partial [Desulfobacterales bacterium]|nr:RNA polymerase sigma factor [Desulfobacterales bacterium]
MKFWDIYYEYHDRVKKFAISFVKDEWVADDITQDTFEKVQGNLGSLNDPTRISAWIFRIAYNLCQDYFRHTKKEIQAGRTLAGQVQIQDVVPMDKKLELHQMNQCVQDKVGRLPESLKSVLTMYDVMGFRHKEIADILGISPGNVKTRLHRARKKLK